MSFKRAIWSSANSDEKPNKARKHNHDKLNSALRLWATRWRKWVCQTRIKSFLVHLDCLQAQVDNQGERFCPDQIPAFSDYQRDYRWLMPPNKPETSSQTDDELSAADYRQRGWLEEEEEEKEEEEKKRKKVLWMTHPLGLPLRYDASTVGYLQQAHTAALPSNMIISRARPQPPWRPTPPERSYISAMSLISYRGLKTYIAVNTRGWFLRVFAAEPLVFDLVM